MVAGEEKDSKQLVRNRLHKQCIVVREELCISIKNIDLNNMTVASCHIVALKLGSLDFEK